MIAAAEFRFWCYANRLPPGRAYMAECKVFRTDEDPIPYVRGGQTLPASRGGTIQHSVSLSELADNGVYEVYAIVVTFYELGGDPTQAALDLDGKPLTFGPVDLYPED